MEMRLIQTRWCIFFCLLCMAIMVHAAFLRNIPQSLKQPDGTILQCFASGDEYYNRLHDAQGYTILQDPATGFYVYGKVVNGELVPTNLIPGKADPAQAGLTPNARISAARYQAISNSYKVPAPPAGGAPANQPQNGQLQTGTLNNIVVFIRFADEVEFADATTTYNDMFNQTGAGVSSMKNYFSTVSYSALTVDTTFYPTPPGATVISYQDGHNRAYYQPFNAVTNPEGYDDTNRTVREHTLLKDAIASIAAQVPANLDIDHDGDNYIDNVCFIVYGSPTGWNTLLWPHRWSLYTQTATINGKTVGSYNLQLQSATGVGVLCHEMFHSLGSPDLYHYYVDLDKTPVGPWDLMEYDPDPPQHMSAYMKYKYGKWIADIPAISLAGTYSLNPLTSATNNCYKIASPNSQTEFFVVEYRKKAVAGFESTLPGSGLLVYRINSARTGNDTPPDEVYVYRPGVTPTADGNVNTAFFSANSGRTEINDTTDPSCFLTAGGPGGLWISNVSDANNTISFFLHGPYRPDLLVKKTTDPDFIGDNSYTNNGTGQIISADTTPGVTVSYTIRVQNDANTDDSITLSAKVNGAGWTPKYYDGANVITLPVDTGVLAPGAYKEYRVEIEPKTFSPGDACSVELTAESNTSAGDTDVAILSAAIPAGPGSTIRMSIHTDGSEGDLDSQFPAVSTDGNLVAFQSDATTLVGGDNNGKRDIFVRNRTTGETTRVSLTAGGGEADGDSYSPAISGDGTIFAYVSDATNLAAGDTNQASDIFVYDSTAGTVTRVSVGVGGAQANGASWGPAISADGKKIVFVSNATNLVAGDTNDAADVFLYNRVTQTTTRLSVTAAGIQGDGDSIDPTISDDGTIVAFSSLATTFAAADSNTNNDIYIKTLATGALQCLTLANDGSASDDGSFLPKLSSNGRYVAFTSRATNLLATGGDINGKQDVYVYDRQAVGGALTLVSKTATALGNGDSGQYGLDISDDGSLVVFESSARNLLGNSVDTNNKSDIFLWTQNTGALSRMSVSTLGDQANGTSRHPALAGDGTLTAFDSYASNLVSNDTNSAYDVFIHLHGKAFQPDMALSADGTTWKGGNVYALDDQQTLERSVNTAVAGTFYAKLYNNIQNPTGTYILKMSGYDAAAGWTVTVKDTTTTFDVPLATLTGVGYQISDLAPDASRTFQITVKTYASLPTTPPLELLLTASSQDDASRKDTVKAVVSLSPYATILASVNNNGSGVGGNDCGFSADGRYVCFEYSGISRHDRQTGITEHVSEAADGTNANGAVADEDISGDGRYIIFKSTATNLTADVTNGVQEIFMKDMVTKAVILVSRADGANGAPADAACDSAVISPNGQFVAFASAATTLLAGGGNGQAQIYLRDVVNNTTTLMSKNDAGDLANNSCYSCAITSTGSFVTWRSTASNLDAAVTDTGGKQDVFIHDVALDKTELVSVNKDGNKAGNDTSSNDYRSPVSDDGRYVAFSSLATDLIDQQLSNNSKRQIFVRDRTNDRTIQLSINKDGNAATDNCERPTMTLDGRYIGFYTPASLLAVDTGTTKDVYIADTTKTGAEMLELASLPYNYDATTKTPLGNIDCGDPFISGDGRYISFEGTGGTTPTGTPPLTNLVPLDPAGYKNTNGQQIYVRDRWLSLKPDLAIKKGMDPDVDASYLKLGTIDATGSSQTLSVVLAAAGTTTTFNMRLTNLSVTQDRITLKGTAGGQGWTVQYLDAQDTDITDEVTSDAGWTTPLLAQNALTPLTIKVTSDPLKLAGDVINLVVTAYSNTNTAIRDRVRASVQVAGANKTDLQIRSTADAAFLGDNVYTDGTDQVKTLTVPNGKTATFVVRVENDGGSGYDSYKLFAQTLDTGSWTLQYKAADGSDITAELTDTQAGWTSPLLDMGEYAEIRVLVTPKATLAGGASTLPKLLISAQSENDPAQGDAVYAITNVATLRQPDLLIGKSAAVKIGDGIYDDGTAQTVQTITQRSTLTHYYVTLENDGNITETYIVTGDAGDADWTIDYYDVTGGGNTKITDAVTTGTYTPQLAMGESKLLRIDVTPLNTLNPGDEKPVTLTAVAQGDDKKTDTVVALTTAAVRKPDLLVKDAAAPGYLGDDEYPPTLQEASQSVDNTVVAAYQLKLQNDGNTGDTYTFTVPADGGGWTYRFYDGTDTTSEITAQLRGGTWKPALAKDGEAEILVHVIPDATLLGGTVNSVTITAQSENEPAYTDVVTLTTTVTPRHQGDAQIQNVGDAGYLGDNQYTGTTQTKAQPIRAGKTASYRVKVENDGNVSETFTLTSTAGGSGWTVDYTDEATGTPVTAALNGAGISLTLAKGASATYLIQVAPDATVASGALQVTTFTVKIGATMQDVVKAQTQLVGSTTRVSVDSLGKEGNGESPSLNSPPAISKDGRYAVFSSTASNLVTGDTNSVSDIFLHDRELGSTTRVSVSGSGAQANGASDLPAISPDGRYIAYRSKATNLVANDTNAKADVFLYDRLTGTVERVSVTTTGAQATGGDSGNYGITVSTDAQYVAFESVATNLTTADTNAMSDIFLRDRVQNKTFLVSRTTGNTVGNGRSQLPAISEDGRYTVFSSFASNLTTGDTNAASDIFRYDRTTGTVSLVSTLGATQGNGNSDDPAISGDGNWIAYITMATNLVTGDTNGTWDVLLMSCTTGNIRRVSAASDDTIGNGASSSPALNADGHFIAFRSYASNLISGDTNGKCDVFVRDVSTSTTYRASVSGSGVEANGDSGGYGLALNGEGYDIVFDSMATNLVPGDTNSRRDVFAREWPAFQPDLMVRKQGTTAYLGDNVYENVDKQTLKVNTPPNVPVAYDLAVSNDGLLSETYQLQMQSAISSKWTVSITDDNGQPVDALEIKNGTVTLTVGGKQTVLYHIQVTPSVIVATGDYQELLFHITSIKFPERGDVVKIRTTRVASTATLTASPATRALVNAPVLLTATPIGSTNVEFSFRARRSDGAGGYIWEDIRDYQPTPTCIWTPTVVASYAVYVYVREIGTARVGSAFATISVTPQISTVSVTANRTFPWRTGSSVGFVAAATGGMLPEYQYQLSVFDTQTQSWGPFNEVRAFSTKGSYSWTPAKAGSYKLRVNARESGTATILATTELDCSIVQSVSWVKLEATPASPQVVGTAITLKAIPTNGLAPEYRFLCQVYDWEGKLVTQEIQPYSPSATCTWTPNMDHVGTVTLLVYVREQGTTVAYAKSAKLSYTVTKP